MTTYISEGFSFSLPFRRKPKEDMLTYDEQRELPNRYKFYDWDKVVFTKQAIDERVYEGYTTIEEINQNLFFHVRETNNFHDGAPRGTSGQWIKLHVGPDEWIDAHWLEKFTELDHLGPLTDIQTYHEAVEKLKEAKGIKKKKGEANG